MITPDHINGLYEALGGLLVLNHCRATLRDKDVAGVSIVSTVLLSPFSAIIFSLQRGAFLTVHPLRLLGKYKPAGRHFFECSLYG
jgi:hypothetical protein